ncbi:MAG: AI-2E family transporter, partial [Planctomycetota bacterium]
MADEAARRRSLFLTVVAAIVVWLAYLSRDAVVPLLVALILAYVLMPVVRRLEGRGMGRLSAVCLLFLCFFGGTTLAVALGGPPLFREAQDLLRATLGEPARTISELPEDLRDRLSAETMPTLETVRNLESEADPDAARLSGNFERHLQSLWDSASPDAVEEFVSRHDAWRVTRYRDRDLIWEDRDRDGEFRAGYLLQGALWAAEKVRSRGGS